ncbi:MAG: hypothetical protein P1P90_04195 [Patescibacteria group bacterium]|nr:hypothetical protein [Patescibacteria group bacterium]
MNKAEWTNVKKTRQSALRGFCRVNAEALAEIASAKAVLKKHAELIREHERLDERAHASTPEGHVRCQAVYHSLLICEEIAPKHNLPKGWVVSVVGDLCYCSQHKKHADVVNAPTREAAEAHHRPQIAEEVVSRR